jgi:hypothetical protein
MIIYGNRFQIRKLLIIHGHGEIIISQMKIIWTWTNDKYTNFMNKGYIHRLAEVHKLRPNLRLKVYSLKFAIHGLDPSHKYIKHCKFTILQNKEFIAP